MNTIDVLSFFILVAFIYFVLIKSKFLKDIVGGVILQPPVSYNTFYNVEFELFDTNKQSTELHATCFSIKTDPSGIKAFGDVIREFTRGQHWNVIGLQPIKGKKNPLWTVSNVRPWGASGVSYSKLMDFTSDIDPSKSLNGLRRGLYNRANQLGIISVGQRFTGGPTTDTSSYNNYVYMGMPLLHVEDPPDIIKNGNKYYMVLRIAMYRTGQPKKYILY